MKKYDVIIIGAGIAGMSCAVNLVEKGLSVCMLIKSNNQSDCNTFCAQGGIISYSKNDNPALLAKDIFAAGNNYNSDTAVEYFSQHGPKLVQTFLMDKIGVDFSKKDNGEIDMTEEAAHSIKRIAHYHDFTGEAIHTSLFNYLEKMGVDILKDWTAIDLITNNQHSKNKKEIYQKNIVMGVYALENKSGNVRSIFSHKVVLATGGVGNLYQYTTNPNSATGDGITMAHKAGAQIINAEFLQFHPTMLFHRDIRRFLISESLRGEGARLKDKHGKEFMKNYSSMRDLAPRDVVSRAIFDKMAIDGSEYMLLDICSYYKGERQLEDRFQKVWSTCKKAGIDITKESIPVVPGAHYFCGGVKVDIAGRTTVDNLYAVGEVSCTGLHGSNRLASTSLLEGLLWGKSAAQDIASSFVEIDKNRFKDIADWKFPKHQIDFDPILIKQDWKTIKQTMWNYAGIVRTAKGLDRAQSDLSYFYRRIMEFYKEGVLNRDLIELRNAVICSQIIVYAALRNEKSIGCHYRKD